MAHRGIKKAGYPGCMQLKKIAKQAPTTRSPWPCVASACNQLLPVFQQVGRTLQLGYHVYIGHIVVAGVEAGTGILL